MDKPSLQASRENGDFDETFFMNPKEAHMFLPQWVTRRHQFPIISEVSGFSQN